MNSGSEFIEMVSPKEYHTVLTKIREFFHKKGFVEAHVQHRLSLLCCCEDPATISKFKYAGQEWGLMQTGQPWLEYEIMEVDSTVPGYYCVTTSYRAEPNPEPGRHSLAFPLIEYEARGDMEDLINIGRELLEHLGFGDKDSFPRGTYEEVANKYGVKELENEHEKNLQRDYGNVFFLTDFPNYTHPYWNMKQAPDGQHAKKVDVIINGVETIGSAERSCDVEEMREQFYSISNGEYAQLLFDQFGKERVEKEVEDFLSMKFFTRCGGGIGLTRLIKAMRENGLLYK